MEFFWAGWCELGFEVVKGGPKYADDRLRIFYAGGPKYADDFGPKYADDLRHTEGIISLVVRIAFENTSR